MKNLLFCAVVLSFFGCTDYRAQYYETVMERQKVVNQGCNKYADYLLKEQQENTENLRKRIVEANLALEKKEITKAEYLNIKNAILAQSESEMQEFNAKLQRSNDDCERSLRE